MKNEAIVPIDKKYVLEHMVYCMIEGDDTLEQAKVEAQEYVGLTVEIKRGDLIYIRLLLLNYVKRRCQHWFMGILETSDEGKEVLAMCDDITTRLSKNMLVVTS